MIAGANAGRCAHNDHQRFSSHYEPDQGGAGATIGSAVYGPKTLPLGDLVHLPELEELAPIVKVDGLTLAIYKNAHGSFGWVLAAGCRAIAFDGWYPAAGAEHLEPLLEILQDPDRDGAEDARILNNRQIAPGIGACGSPLGESGLDSMFNRADDVDARGWGSAGLRDNQPFQQARIIAVAALGSGDTLRGLADRI